MNRSVHLEFACQARRSCKVTFLSQIGNGPEGPIGKYPECTGTSTLDIQEDVDKRISELCNKLAERIHFRAGYPDPKRVSADNAESDRTERSFVPRLHPLA